jgi:hypothetical protein
MPQPHIKLEKKYGEETNVEVVHGTKKEEPGPPQGNVKETITIYVTNPCIYYQLGGQWYSV